MSEAANSEGADARSPEAEVRWFPLQTERRGYDKPMFTRIPWSVAEKAYALYSARYGRDQSLERLAERGGFGHYEMDTFYPDWREEVDENARLRRELAAASEAERAAESRGAKAGRAEAAEYLERCAQDMRMRGAPWTGFGLLVMHAQRIRSLSAEGATPSGSPSVPAAQPRPTFQEWAMAAGRAAILTKGSTAQLQVLTGAIEAAYARGLEEVLSFIVTRSPPVPPVNAIEQFITAKLPGRALDRISEQPRAAPTPALPREAACICYGMPPGEHSPICPALPREAPEPGGTLAESGRWVLPGGATGFVNPPQVCNACGEPLLTANLLVDDGCPCNSPRGVNLTPMPCALCRTDCCVKPGHRLAGHSGVPLTTDQPRAAPTDPAPATPGLGPPSAGSLEWVRVRVLSDLEMWSGTTRDERPVSRVVSDTFAALERRASGESRVAPSSPESPAVAADAGDRKHE